ncbi:MAG: hypothetical protein WC412_07400 [Candidatus Omnitrophota bacterium]
MKKTLFLLVILAAVAGNLYAQQTEVLNGNGWKLLNRYIEGRTMRMVLVQGIISGAQVMNTERAKEVYPSTDYNSLAAMLDDFYNDDKNLSIATPYALYIVSLKVKNRPKSDIDEAIRKFREGFKMQFVETEKEKK